MKPRRPYRRRRNPLGHLSPKLILPLASLLLVGGTLTASAQSATEGQELFKNRCTACHSIGGGKIIGPDLAGVTTRREPTWLQRQIREPQTLIAEKDPIVMELLKQSNNIPMPSLGLSDAQVTSVIEYLKSTETQGAVASSLPPQYVPTILISFALVAGLSFAGVRAGARNDGEEVN